MTVVLSGRAWARAARAARAITSSVRAAPSRTSFQVVGRLPGHAWVQAKPVSGRTHQIRVHLSHVGHPIVGDKIYDRTCTFDLTIGPLGLEEFETFLPEANRVPEMRELVDIFNCDSLDYWLELWIKAEEIPPLNLGGESARLGWTTWAGSPPPDNQRVRFLMKGWLHGRR